MEKSELSENNNPELSRGEALNRTFEAVVLHFDELKDEFFSPPSADLGKLCQRAEETKKDWGTDSPEEKLIVDCFLSIPAETQRQEEKKKLDSLYRAPGIKIDSIKEKARNEMTNQINTAFADWQIKCAQLIRTLDEHPEQRQIISALWQRTREVFIQQFPGQSRINKFKKEGEIRFSDLRRGIINLVSVTRIIEKLGLGYEFPTPEQDALDKIDLLIIHPGGDGIRRGTIALQLKSDRKLTIIDGQIGENPESSQREERELKKLRRAAFALGRERQIKVSPLRLTIPPLKVDFVTGKLREHEEPLKQYLYEKIQGLLAKK